MPSEVRWRGSEVTSMNPALDMSSQDLGAGEVLGGQVHLKCFFHVIVIDIFFFIKENCFTVL